MKKIRFENTEKRKRGVHKTRYEIPADATPQQKAAARRIAARQKGSVREESI